MLRPGQAELELGRTSFSNPSMLVHWGDPSSPLHPLESNPIIPRSAFHLDLDATLEILDTCEIIVRNPAPINSKQPAADYGCLRLRQWHD